MNTQLKLDRKDIAGADFLQTLPVHGHATLRFDKQGNAFAEGMITVEDWTLLPQTAVAAGTNFTFNLSGTNADNNEVVKAADGGITLTAEGADDDQAQVSAIANTNAEITLGAAVMPVFRTQVNVAQLTKCVASAGWCENALAGGNPDPDPSAQAGEGARFVYWSAADIADATVNPTSAISAWSAGVYANGNRVQYTTAVAGVANDLYYECTQPTTNQEPTVDTAYWTEVHGPLATADLANWICHVKINGVDTYYPTEIPVVANQDYELAIAIGPDLKPKFYIDGVLVVSGVTALTSGDKVYAIAGIQALEAATKAMDCRFISISRRFG